MALQIWCRERDGTENGPVVHRFWFIAFSWVRWVPFSHNSGADRATAVISFLCTVGVCASLSCRAIQLIPFFVNFNMKWTQLISNKLASRLLKHKHKHKRCTILKWQQPFCQLSHCGRKAPNWKRWTKNSARLDRLDRFLSQRAYGTRFGAPSTGFYFVSKVDSDLTESIIFLKVSDRPII